MVGAVLELSSSWVSSALSAPLQKPLFPVISMLTWNTKFRVNLPKFGPKTGPEIGSKKGFKTRPKWVFQFWPPFWSQFWAQFGFQFWSQFWPQFWVRFWSQFWAHFGSKSNSFCGFWLRCRSGASRETRSGAKMVPEAMRNHFAGTKVLRNTLQVSNQTRESYIERSLTRIFPKCLLEVKAEKDFNICILDFWNCIFQDFSPILYRPKDLLVCLLGCPWFINSSNIFAWLVFFETVQICKNKGDTAGVFEGKFFTDNLIA